jgi:hypothetical protein
MDIKDLCRLSLANHKSNAKISEEFIIRCIVIRIATELRKIFGPDYDRFVKAMVQAKGVLSGSFLIQCILDEKWDNSDIDLYVGNEESDKIIHKFFGIDGEDYYNGYYRRLGHIENISNFNIKPMDYYYDYVKVQVVQVKTDKKYSLWDHIRNTGFDICKNMLYFDKKGNMQLKLENLQGIVNKQIVFTILDTDDFLFRMKKYSYRGFMFKPKYNKLFYLEYVLLKKYRAKVGINKDKSKKFNPDGCHSDCIVKLLFRNVKHFHVRDYDYNRIFIDNSSGIINGLVPCLRVGYAGDSSKFRSELWKCKSLDDYVNLRRRLTVDKSIFAPRADLKYDIQYGLEYQGKLNNDYLHRQPSASKTKNKSQQVDKNGWTLVGKKKDSQQSDAKQELPKTTPIDKTTSWANHLKKLHNKKN